jgi:hypothetical protein
VPVSGARRLQTIAFGSSAGTVFTAGAGVAAVAVIAAGAGAVAAGIAAGGADVSAAKEPEAAKTSAVAAITSERWRKMTSFSPTLAKMSRRMWENQRSYYRRLIPRASNRDEAVQES